MGELQEVSKVSDPRAPIGDPRSLRSMLMSVSERLEKMLPPQFSGHVEQFIDRTVLGFVSSKQTTELMECTRESVLSETLRAAQYGFVMDNKFVYPLPYNNKVKTGKTERWFKQVQASFDYKALIAVAKRHSHIIDVRAQAVREGDEYEAYEENFQQHYRFKKGKGERGEYTDAFAVLLLADGRHTFAEMSIEELKVVRGKSKSPNSPAWQDFPDRMYCKVVVKRALTYYQDDPVIGQLLEYDNREYDMEKTLSSVAVSSKRAQSMDDLADRLSQPRIESVAPAPDFKAAAGEPDEAEKAYILAQERELAREQGYEE